MPLSDDAKQAGAQAVDALRRRAVQRLAGAIRGDPQIAASAVEVGLVDRDWLDDPTDRPIRSATTVEMVHRLLERSVEQRPSALGSLGLSAVELLATGRGDDLEGTGTSAPVTVLFTDLEGFTRYTAEVGDARAVELLHDHHRVVGPVVRSRGGRIVKRLGDGLLLSFPNADAAVLAALELVDLAPEPLRLRAGMHTGDAVVTHDDLMGHVVNVAARVTEAAEGGQVLITDAVRAEVEQNPAIGVGRRRRTTLKGVPEAVWVTRVELSR